MQTTSTSTRTRSQTRSKAVIPNSVRSKRTVTATRTRKTPAISNVYVLALKEASAFHKSSFHIEMAVCLAFYTEHENADLNIKKQLRLLYEEAGYDCKQPSGDDYKTVQRRISVAADLYTSLGGHEKVYDWMNREQGALGIHTLVKELEKRNLDNISIVKASLGQSQTRTYTKRATAKQEQPALPASISDADKALAEAVAASVAATITPLVQQGPQLRRSADHLPAERIMRTDHIVCAIPFDATPDEVKALALKLLEFATTVMAAASTAGVPAQT